MSAIDELLAANRELASAAPPGATARPSRRVTVVTCMDGRIDVHAALGLRAGEAHVLRNAGGIVTDDVIRSLAVSQRLLDTREVMLIQHTDCGMRNLDERRLRRELTDAGGAEPPFEIGSFDDLQSSVRQSVQAIRSSPFLPHTDLVRGFVFDEQSGLLREVQDGVEG